jgi:tripartite-type tricarboxylate transporter receptor subunit TctC
MRVLFAAAILAASCVGTLPSSAQPRLNIGANQIRLVVPGPPGGPAGATAQMLATKASLVLGQTVVVDYRAGAGGNIAITHVAQSKGDGSTLFFAVPAIITNPYFQKIAASPDVLAPVIQINSGAFVLLVKPDSPVKSVADLVTRIKAEPGKVTCAAGAVALSTVSCHLLEAHAGKMLMINYQGNAPASAALSRGEIDTMFDFVNVAGSAVREGRLRALAITSTPAPGSFFKDLPLISQTVPNFDLMGWQGIMVPRETPRDVVMTINEAFNKVLEDEEVRKMFATADLKIEGGTPEYFAARVKRDYEFYGKIAKEAAIVPQ